MIVKYFKYFTPIISIINHYINLFDLKIVKIRVCIAQLNNKMTQTGKGFKEGRLLLVVN